MKTQVQVLAFPGNYQSPWESPSLLESRHNREGIEAAAYFNA